MHTIDHPDTIAFARELRQAVDAFEPPRFLVGEVFGDARTLKRYCGDDAQGLHLVFLFETLRAELTAPSMKRLIDGFECEFAAPYSPTYVFGNHDRPRSARGLRKHAAKMKLRAALQLTVRGVPFIYYGEEIGMEDHEIPLHEGLDPIATRFGFAPQWLVKRMRERGVLLNRDECRSPMQWSDAPNAGFTRPDTRPWLPVHPNAARINVAAQETDPCSILSCYRALLALRREQPSLQAGKLAWIETPGLKPHVLAYERSMPDGSAPPVEVYLNFSTRPRSIDIRAHRGGSLYSTTLCRMTTVSERYVLGPHEGIVVFDAR